MTAQKCFPSNLHKIHRRFAEKTFRQLSFSQAWVIVDVQATEAMISTIAVYSHRSNQFRDQNLIELLRLVVNF